MKKKKTDGAHDFESNIHFQNKVTMEYFSKKKLQSTDNINILSFIKQQLYVFQNLVLDNI